MLDALIAAAECAQHGDINLLECPSLYWEIGAREGSNTWRTIVNGDMVRVGAAIEIGRVKILASYTRPMTSEERREMIDALTKTTNEGDAS